MDMDEGVEIKECAKKSLSERFQVLSGPDRVEHNSDQEMVDDAAECKEIPKKTLSERFAAFGNTSGSTGHVEHDSDKEKLDSDILSTLLNKPSNKTKHRSENHCMKVDQDTDSNDVTEDREIEEEELAGKTDKSIPWSESKMEVNSETDKPPSSPDTFLDYSDDSADDDDLLSAAPAFLKSVEDIVNPRLPSRVQQDGACRSSKVLHDSPSAPEPSHPSTKLGVTLDRLFTEYETNVRDEEELNEISKELQDGIKQGGILQVLSRDDEDIYDESLLTQDRQEFLKELQVSTSAILDDRPGEAVFHPQQFRCRYTETLLPTHCGFTVGCGSHIERHIQGITQDQCLDLLTSDLIQLCFRNISCKEPLLKWLFFLMSVHSDCRVRKACERLLLDLLTDFHWTPTPADIMSVLLNCGANLNSLVPEDLLPEEDFTQTLFKQPESSGCHDNNSCYKKENLFLMLKIVAKSLQGNPEQYSEREITMLLTALFKASLDISLQHLCAVEDFQICIGMLIKQYKESDWLKKRVHVCQVLASVTDHHHNMSYVAQLLPRTTRGVYLRRGVGYRMLTTLLPGTREERNQQTAESLQIKDFCKFVKPMRDLLLEDPYTMSSVVILLDLAVGINQRLRESERVQLKYLMDLLKRIRIKDDVSNLDRTMVMGMLVRVTSCWAVEIQAHRGIQTKIFEYTASNSPMKMQIEKVQACQSDGSDSSGEQTDGDEDEIPCKIPKLETEIKR